MFSRNGSSEPLFSEVLHIPPDVVASRVQRIEDLYPHEFWLEKYERMNRTIGPVFEQFNPSNIVDTITPKCNSKAENDWCRLNGSRYLHFRQSIEDKSKAASPPTMLLSSHVYGYHQQSQQLDQNGNVIRGHFRPKRRAFLSDFSEQLDINRITERPRFGGLAFKC